MNEMDSLHIDINFLDTVFDQSHFVKTNKHIVSSETIKYDYMLDDAITYQLWGFKLDQLYLNETNGRVTSFRAKLKDIDDNFYEVIANTLGKPRSITFLDKETDSLFKAKFLKGLIKKDSDIPYKKIKSCHWYQNDTIVINFYNAKKSNLSRYDGIEVSVSTR
ncbi:hypothetical protein [uncultured Psychroserpens sp.]|uniref:hypothetical protein n=1 Tax=uncultured Psychroserpens sp. TaxID=255436 RepID=UPI00261922E4|nr:hypothetical protein [uncultured Psychroserpens sp.]